MLSFEDHALFERDTHACSVLGALTAHETTSIQPPTDLEQTEKYVIGARWNLGHCASVYTEYVDYKYKLLFINVLARYIGR